MAAAAANDDALDDDVSSTTTTACELDDNSELISAEIGIDCWESHAEREMIRAEKGMFDNVTKLSKLNYKEVEQAADELALKRVREANEARKEKQQKRQKGKKEPEEPEGKFEQRVVDLLAAWIEKNSQRIEIDGTKYEVYIGGKKWPYAPAIWAHNFRKSRMKDTLPDIQFYIIDGDDQAVQIGCIEMKSGKSGKGPATNQGDRSNLQQATSTR